MYSQYGKYINPYECYPLIPIETTALSMEWNHHPPVSPPSLPPTSASFRAPQLRRCCCQWLSSVQRRHAAKRAKRAKSWKFTNWSGDAVEFVLLETFHEILKYLKVFMKTTAVRIRKKTRWQNIKNAHIDILYERPAKIQASQVETESFFTKFLGHPAVPCPGVPRSSIPPHGGARASRALYASWWRRRSSRFAPRKHLDEVPHGKPSKTCKFKWCYLDLEKTNDAKANWHDMTWYVYIPLLVYLDSPQKFQREAVMED